MMRISRVIALCLALPAMAAALAACAVESIPYPRLATVKNLKNRILSREERDEAIRNLSAEQQSHEKAAIEQIEKSQ